MKRILGTGCNGQLGRAINEEYKNDNVTLKEPMKTFIKKLLQKDT